MSGGNKTYEGKKKTSVKETDVIGILLCRVIRESLSEEVACCKGLNEVMRQPPGQGG